MNSKKALSDYIRKLDRLRWEYLRESDKYRKDWAEWKAVINSEEAERIKSERESACGDCELETCDDGNCEYSPLIMEHGEINQAYINGSIMAYHRQYKQKDWGTSLFDIMNPPPSVTTKLWVKYGIHLIVSPDLTYDEAISKHPVKNPEGRLIFYTDLTEYGIHEGIYSPELYKSSPLLPLTVNISMPIKTLVEEFRNIVSKNKTLLKKSGYQQVISKKWILPKNVHFDALEEALKHHRLHKTNSYLDMVWELQQESRSQDSSLLALAKKNVLKARRIIKNVENGIFPYP